MMKLIQNIDVYAPQHLGKKDVLIINDKIVKIKDAGSICADGFLSEAEMINGEGLLLTPGFIDSHVHVLGGGGEGGFHVALAHVDGERLLHGGQLLPLIPYSIP